MLDRDAIRNPNVIKPRPYCTKKKKRYDTEAPLTPLEDPWYTQGHIQNTNEFIEEHVGKDHRKHGLQDLGYFKTAR